MNEPVRLSVSGSPLARQLVAAGRRERPRDDDDRKGAVLAAALLLANEPRCWWKATWLLGLGLLVGSAATLALTNPPEKVGLASEPILFYRRYFEPPPFVPADFAPEAEPPSAARSTIFTIAPPKRPLESTTSNVPSELELLRTARIQSASGDPSSALATLDEHARLYPKGLLWEEAEALRVEALARSGDVDAAQAAAVHFANRYPQSAYLERVQSIGTKR